MLKKRGSCGISNKHIENADGQSAKTPHQPEINNDLDCVANNHDLV